MKLTTRAYTRRPVASVLLVALAVLLSLAVPARAAETPGKEPAPTGAALSAADARTRAIEERAARLQEIVDARSGLGVYFDQAASDLVVVIPASGRGSDLSARDLSARGLSGRVVRRNITADAVEGINKTIEAGAFHPDARRYTYASHLDLQRGVMVVETNAPADVVGRLSDGFPGAIEVVKSEGQRLTRRSDSTPHWGGASITNWSSTCTSGFSVKNSAGTRFMVTAGHCFPLGASVYSPDSPYYSWGTVTNRASFPTWDLELLGGSSYGTYIYSGPVIANGTRKVMGAANPVVGYPNYCHSGQTTGEHCGHEVTSLSGQFCDAAGCTPGLIAYKKGTSLKPGDSGSPFYLPLSNGMDARGINIAISGSTMYAEKWSTIASYFGVSIVT